MIFHVVPEGEGNPHKASFFYDDFGSGLEAYGTARFVPPVELSTDMIKRVKDDVGVTLTPLISTAHGTIVDFKRPLIFEDEVMTIKGGEAVHKLVIQGLGIVLEVAGKATNPAIFEEYSQVAVNDQREYSVPEHLEDEFPSVAEVTYSAVGERLSEPFKA